MNIEEFYKKHSGTSIEFGDTFEWELYDYNEAEELLEEFKDEDVWDDNWSIIGYDVRGEPIFINSENNVFIYSSDEDGEIEIKKIFDNLIEFESFIIEVKELKIIINQYKKSNPDLIKNKMKEIKKNKKKYVVELIESEIEDFWE